MAPPLYVGPLALRLIQHFESCELRAYPDDGGVWTIGWGETGPHVRRGLVWMQAQCDAAFAGRLALEFVPGVRRAIGDAPTTPAQFGAMVALAYNIGVAAFAGSSVARFHRAGRYADAAAAFLPWNKVRNPRTGRREVSGGLVRRRHAESALYRSDFEGVAKFTFGKVQA